MPNRMSQSSQILFSAAYIQHREDILRIPVDKHRTFRYVIPDTAVFQLNHLTIIIHTFHIIVYVSDKTRAHIQTRKIFYDCTYIVHE